MSLLPKSNSSRELIIRALARAEIPNSNDPRARSLFGSIYWNEPAEGQIELHISTWRFNVGRLTCSIGISDIAEHIVQLLGDDIERLSALVDTLEYFKAVLITLLPITQNKLLNRVHGITTKSLAKSDKSGLAALFEMMQAAFVDGRAAAENQLAGKHKKRRGGSEPKLSPEKRNSLHIEYDDLHKIAREVKRDYNQTLKRFEKSRRGRGYPNKEWQLYWRTYLSEKYPPELIEDFLEVFASEDSPSPSDIAYLKLSKLTGHTRSYLPQLVAESRKAQKVSTIKGKD